MEMSITNKSSNTKTTNSKRKCHDLIYDSIKIEFNFEVFIWEFMLHLTFPFMIFFCKNIHCHKFSSTLPYDILNQWILPIAFVTMVLSYSFATVSVEGEMLNPAFFYIFHKAMIAFKYATLSEGEYKRITTCTLDEIIDEYQNQMQLITGWLDVYPAFVDYELDASARRMDADLQGQVFIVADRLKNLKNKVFVYIYL